MTHLRRLVESGRIGTWSIPGAIPRYSQRDAERVRDEAFRPAVPREPEAAARA